MNPRVSQKTVAVVGLGYVGLPLAVLAQEKGWRALGYDVSEKRVADVNSRRCPLEDKALARQLEQHPIEASNDPAIVASADVIIIAVPTPVTADNEPDLRPLTSALAAVAPHLKDDQLLVVESTINPGVMDEIVRPLLAEQTDANVHLAHCPERINPGDSKWTVRNIPRVLGAYSPAAVTRAREFYESVLEAPVKIMASPTEAEAVKILENTFRDINIAFINEMAKSFDVLGIDITNVISGAATKPFAFMPHYPGNGVGGHCISVDPYYMIERARQAGFDHQFLKLARRINESMPAYTIELLEHALHQHGASLAGTTVALLGVAYKKNVADTRNSPALKTLSLLHARGAVVEVYDPFVPRHSTVDSLAAALKRSEVVLLACDHPALVEELLPTTLAAAGIHIVIDGRNALDAGAISANGITYIGIGRGRTTLHAPAALATVSSNISAQH
jgi:UDP-N-acetyl-D-glucosamine dehydrogenase